MDPTQLIINALIFIFPAYCANAVPVVAGGGCPVDFGKRLSDGRPIFGKNKTFRGFFSGLALGSTVGYIEAAFLGYPLFFGLVLSLGALFGDLAGAFLKRRLGIAPGGPLPVVDQIDFIVGSTLFSFLMPLPFLTWELVGVVLAITPPMHLLTNYSAYKLNLKSNPW